MINWRIKIFGDDKELTWNHQECSLDVLKTEVEQKLGYGIDPISLDAGMNAILLASADHIESVGYIDIDEDDAVSYIYNNVFESIRNVMYYENFTDLEKIANTLTEVAWQIKNGNTDFSREALHDYFSDGGDD